MELNENDLVSCCFFHDRGWMVWSKYTIQTFCDIDQVQTSSIRWFTYWHDYFIIYWECFVVAVVTYHKIQFRKLSVGADVSFYSFAIIVLLLHFCVCALESVRLNFPNPYLKKANLKEEETHFFFFTGTFLSLVEFYTRKLNCI